jgi:hypothetical protein
MTYRYRIDVHAPGYPIIRLRVEAESADAAREIVRKPAEKNGFRLGRVVNVGRIREPRRLTNSVG